MSRIKNYPVNTQALDDMDRNEEALSVIEETHPKVVGGSLVNMEKSPVGEIAPVTEVVSAKENREMHQTRWATILQTGRKLQSKPKYR